MTWGELVVNESDLTVSEAVDICALADGGWEVLNPLRSPTCAASILAVMRSSRTGVDTVIAAKEIAAMPVVELLACVTRS